MVKEEFLERVTASSPALFPVPILKKKGGSKKGKGKTKSKK
jgi:hypothetical protein